MEHCTFVDENGVRYPFDRVASYRELGDGFLEVELASGMSYKTTRVDGDGWRECSKNAIRFITPATPGTYFVTREQQVADEPIIAWAQTYGAYGLAPMDAHGPITDFAPGDGILHPDGKVVVPRARTFETRQQWHKWLLAEFVMPAQRNNHVDVKKAAS